MTKPTPRSDLVKAVSEAAGIVQDAFPVDRGASESWQQETLAFQVAALPVILRELLDYEVE